MTTYKVGYLVGSVAGDILEFALRRPLELTTLTLQTEESWA